MPVPATDRTPLLPRVSDRTPLLPRVSDRTPLLPCVSDRTPLLPCVSDRTPLLPCVSDRTPLLPRVSDRTPLLPRVSDRTPLLPCATDRTPLLPRVTDRTPLLPRALAVLLGGLLVGGVLTWAGEGYAATGCDDPATGAASCAEPGAPVRASSAARGFGAGVRISADGRSFTGGDGAPFFWLGDAARDLVVDLNRSETRAYLDARAGQGFTVLEAAALVADGGDPEPDQYGDAPLRSGRPAVTGGVDAADDDRYDYWDHLDFVVDEAAARGMVVALQPASAGVPDAAQAGSAGIEDAGAYGRFLGSRYADTPNVVWVLGGDAGAWGDLEAGLRAGGSDALVATQPAVGQASAASPDDGQDVHLLRGGECLSDDQRRDLVDATYAAGRPFVDGDPVREDRAALPGASERPLDRTRRPP